ncbi:MAG: glycosyltransferase family 9 protein [Bacteroidota bacterium]|nr:glycosyltransferase family 9 protein [Bacteroidota bacterium]
MGVRDNLLASLVLFNYNVQNFLLCSLERLLFDRAEKIEAQRILVLKQGMFGDTISALPALLAIREKYPKAQIDLLTHIRLPGRVGVEDLVPEDLFTNIHRYQHFVDKELFHTLRNASYTHFIELPAYIASFSFELRSMIIAKRLNISSGMGWRISSNRFLPKIQEQLLDFQRESERLLSILMEEGLVSPENAASFSGRAQKFYRNLQASGFEVPPKSICLITGAARPRNQWPLAYFREVAEYFIAKGFAIILIGGESKNSLSGLLPHSQAILDLTGKLTPLQNADVLKRCLLVISNDTGPMHMTYMVGTPLIAIFSKFDYPGKWFPPDSTHAIVLRDDPQNISPSAVITHAESLLFSSITV